MINKILKLLVLTLVLNSCNFEIDSPDKAVCTDYISSIVEAKKLGVFMKECMPKTVKIKDSITLKIIETWYEMDYLYSDLENDNKLKFDFIPTTYHLAIKIEGDLRKKYKGFDVRWNFDNFFVLSDSTLNVTLLVSKKDIPMSIPILDSFQVQLYGSIISKDINKYDQLYKLDSFYVFKKQQ